jgi:hypothetical protein
MRGVAHGGWAEHGIQELGLVLYYDSLCAACRLLPSQRRPAAHLSASRGFSGLWVRETQAPELFARAGLIDLSKVTYGAFPRAYIEPALTPVQLSARRAALRGRRWLVGVSMLESKPISAHWRYPHSARSASLTPHALAAYDAWTCSFSARTARGHRLEMVTACPARAKQIGQEAARHTISRPL